MNIEKKLYHIWIGPKPPPKKWMKTWENFHSNWNYFVFTQKDLENKKFINQHLIDEYMKRKKYSGAADLIRYELLYEWGGFIPEADSICLNNTEELFTYSHEYCYSCYEKPFGKNDLVSPILASNPKNKFLKLLIETLNTLNPKELSNKPWLSTGNKWLGKMIKKHNPKIVIFPSHYFIPNHYNGQSYTGNDKIYADQLWGSTSYGTNYERGT